MPYTLLHISDLHRAREDPIGNDELLSTLIADRDRYLTSETLRIPKPDAIVVSGDLVEGVALGAPAPDDALSRQYEMALDLLCRLADVFVDGDRERVVVVPGNHDVDWNMSRASMTPVEAKDLPPGFSPEMCGPAERWRWDWRERQGYEITNAALYDRRLHHFNTVTETFYGASAVVRRNAYRIHRLFDGRIAVVAFNSCSGNDCFAYHGAIDEDAIAQAHMELRGENICELMVAVWHHSIEGDPYRTDYMSVSSVYRLIGKGFRVGLHGHQHRAAASLRYVHLPQEERMAVVSAGSLCAGHRGLPTGVNRQYNLLEFRDDLRSVRVHVREMAIATNFAPSVREELGFRSYVDLDWTLPATSQAASAARELRMISAAERAAAENDFATARAALLKVERPPGSYPRRLLLTILKQANMWDELIDEIGVPGNVEEIVEAVTALVEKRDFEAAERLISDRAADVPAATAHDLRAVIDARRRLA